MKHEQWEAIVTRAHEELGLLLEEHAPRMLSAYTRHDNKLSVNLTAVIASKGAFAVDVKASISYVVDSVKASSGEVRIDLAQEPLPGMPEETKPARRKAGAA